MELTKDQQESLRLEDFRVDVEKVRRGAESSHVKKTKPWWERLLATIGGAALVTTFFGGIAGTVITSVFQTYQKDREFQNAWLQSRGDHALVSYKEYLKGQQETVKDFYDLVGASIAAAEDVISITGVDFNLQHYAEQDRQVIALQKGTIRYNFTKQDELWRQRKQTVGFMLNYYHENTNEFNEARENAVQSVSHFMDCSRRWYLEHARVNKYETLQQVAIACQEQRTDMTDKLNGLNKLLRSTSQICMGWLGIP